MTAKDSCDFSPRGVLNLYRADLTGELLKEVKRLYQDIVVAKYKEKSPRRQR